MLKSDGDMPLQIGDRVPAHIGSAGHYGEPLGPVYWREEWQGSKPSGILRRGGAITSVSHGIESVRVFQDYAGRRHITLTDYCGRGIYWRRALRNWRTRITARSRWRNFSFTRFCGRLAKPRVRITIVLYLRYALIDDNYVSYSRCTMTKVVGYVRTALPYRQEYSAWSSDMGTRKLSVSYLCRY